ncbi:MAG TPA: DNA-binding protein [Kamptonema sp.]|nr:DNA-binding protein [Kamptonema sp.]
MTVQQKGQRIQISLDVSPEVYETLESLAQKMKGDTSEVFRKAIALLKIAVEAEEDGKKMGVANKDQTLDTEILGILPNLENQ